MLSIENSCLQCSQSIFSLVKIVYSKVRIYVCKNERSRQNGKVKTKMKGQGTKERLRLKKRLRLKRNVKTIRK